MEVAARSYLMTGVALVGAGAIVAAPIQPLPPDISVPAVQTAAIPVELNALVNPIELWAEVIGTAVGNVGDLAETVLANPAPILANIVNNQLITAGVLTDLVTTFGASFITGVGNVPAALQSAVDQILAGDIQGGVTGLATAFLTPVLVAGLAVLPQLPAVSEALQNPFQNAANVIGTVVSLDTLLGLGFPLLIEAIAPVAQVGVTGQAIFDGLEEGDLEAVANAIISFPSDLANTILNGSDSEFIGNNGLLGEGGLIDSLLNFRQSIADAIEPPGGSVLAVSKTPDLTAESVTISTAELKTAGDGSLSQNLGAEQGQGLNEGSGTDADETVAVVNDEDLAAVDDDPKDGAGAGEVDLVRNSPIATPGKLGTKTDRPGQRAAAAIQSSVKKFGDDVKKFGDDVKKALGVKPKEDKPASTDSAESDE